MSRLVQSIDEQHPVVMGAVSLAALLVPFGVLFQLGVWFNEWVWAESASVPSWELPYLVGVVVGLVMFLIVNRLMRSRANAWFAYFDAWTNTLDYPRE